MPVLLQGKAAAALLQSTQAQVHPHGVRAGALSGGGAEVRLVGQQGQGLVQDVGRSRRQHPRDQSATGTSRLLSQDDPTESREEVRWQLVAAMQARACRGAVVFDEAMLEASSPADGVESGSGTSLPLEEEEEEEDKSVLELLGRQRELLARMLDRISRLPAMLKVDGEVPKD
eukprot:755608-Hanusia_phi.AAC.1